MKYPRLRHRIAVVAFTFSAIVGTLLPALAFALVSSGTYVWTDQSSAGSRDWLSITSSPDGSFLAAVPTLGDVFISTNAGVSWTDDSASGFRSWQAITSANNGGLIAAAVSGGDIYISTSTGATWTNESSAGSRSWISITASANGGVLAAANENGDIYVSTTTGATWTDETAAGSRNWRSIVSSSDGSVLAAVEQGGDIYVSTTTGATWTDESSAGSRSWFSIAASSNGSVLAAVNDGGDIYVSTTTGATWTDETAAGSRDWGAITLSSDGSVIAAVADNGDIFISLDGGVTWTDQTSAGSQGWAAITSSSDGTKLAAAAFPGDIWTGIPDNPSVTLSAPAPAATVSGSSVALQATASDTATSTANVSFYIDNALVGTAVGTTSPYTYSWNSTGASNGSHSIFAVVESAVGVYATSSSVSFTVNNVAATNQAASESAGLPWCSGPMAPGWNTNIPGGGCNASSGMLGTPIVPVATPPVIAIPVSAPVQATGYDFTRDLHKGMSGPDVLALQQYLNANGSAVAASGAGSPGNETDYFGQATFNALIQFQNAHAAQILVPQDLTQGTGYFGSATRTFVNAH